MNKRRYSARPLPPPAKFSPGKFKPGRQGRLPMAEAPTVPGRYVVKLVGAYGLSVQEYTGPWAVQQMEDNHRAGVAFYEKVEDDDNQ